MADQTALVSMIDEALERFGSRDLVSGAEVLDFLLDLRLAIPGTPDVARAAARGRESAHRLVRRRSSTRQELPDERGQLVGLLERQPVRGASITSRRASGISAANVSA